MAVLKSASASKRKPVRIGKAQAREQLPALVESVALGGPPVEISYYGKVEAVLVSYAQYNWLLSQARSKGAPERKLRGAFKIEDDLQELSRQVAADFEVSIKKTAAEL